MQKLQLSTKSHGYKYKYMYTHVIMQKKKNAYAMVLGNILTRTHTCIHM